MSKLIAISSIRDGVGKTCIATLLSRALHNQDKKVLVIDNSYLYCDMNKFFGVSGDYGLDEIKPYLESDSLTYEILQKVITHVDEGLSLIAGSHIKEECDNLEGSHILILKELLKDEYDYIIIDTIGGFRDKRNYELLKISDQIITISGSTDIHLEQLANQLNDIKKLDVEFYKTLKSNMVVILNKYEREANSDLGILKDHINKNEIIEFPYNKELASMANGYKYSLSTSGIANVLPIFDSNYVIKGKKRKFSLFSKKGDE